MVKITEIIKIIICNYGIYKENKYKFYFKKLGLDDDIEKLRMYIAFNIFFIIIILYYAILGAFYPDFFFVIFLRYFIGYVFLIQTLYRMVVMFEFKRNYKRVEGSDMCFFIVFL